MALPSDYSDRLSAILTNPGFIARRSLARHLVPLLTRTVRTGHRWVDVGCGTRPYETIFKGASYLGVDVPQSGRAASEKKPDLTYDGRTLPMEDSSFDGLLSTQVLEHVPDPGALVDEFARVLKPGGILVVSMPFFWPQHEKPYDFHRFTEFGARRLLEDRGFAVKEMFKTSGSAETLAQAISAYLAGSLIARLPFGRSLFLGGLCAPIQFLGLALQAVLPDDGDLYLDNVVLAEKKT